MSFFVYLLICHYCSDYIKVKALQQISSDNFKLVWSDEFNTDGLPDSSKWRFETGFVRNNEAQWYQKENAVCQNGYLIITGKKENKANPNYIKDSNNWKTNRKNIEFTSSVYLCERNFLFSMGRLK